MFSWFRKFFCKPTLIPGQIIQYRWDGDSPWDDIRTMEIIDVRDGWVKFEWFFGSMCRHETMKISWFWLRYGDYIIK